MELPILGLSGANFTLAERAGTILMLSLLLLSSVENNPDPKICLERERLFFSSILQSSSWALDTPTSGTWWLEDLQREASSPYLYNVSSFQLLGSGSVGPNPNLLITDEGWNVHGPKNKEFCVQTQLFLHHHDRYSTLRSWVKVKRNRSCPWRQSIIWLYWASEHHRLESYRCEQPFPHIAMTWYGDKLIPKVFI